MQNLIIQCFGQIDELQPVDNVVIKKGMANLNLSCLLQTVFITINGILLIPL